MTTAKKMIQVASSYIGTKGDHNIFNKWYWVTYTKTYTSDPGTAWCACFMSYVAMKAGLKCSYSASAAGFATQFERIPVEKENTVKPGDIVIFNWDNRTSTSWSDHVGLVEWSTIGKDGLFGTIEGNTGNAAEGQVLRVTRDNYSTYFTAFYRPKYDAAAASTTSSAAKSSSSKVLYGIDVSSNQPADIFSLVKADFGIVKMTGNPQQYKWNFVNPDAKQQVSDIHKKTGMSGLYHFTWGKDAIAEADLFVENVKKTGYLGKSILVVDYEAQATSLGKAWVKKLADRIKSETGVAPVIYASGSVITSQGLKDLGYPIWCANYYKGYERVDGYDTSGMKIWSGCEDAILWQFTSSGYLKGYGSKLDLDACYIGKAKWQELAKVKTPSQSKPASSSSSGAAAAKKKTVAQLAEEVLAGKWGNGDDRKRRLTNAGYSWKKVQAEVNVLIAAKDVLAGKYGNGAERKKKLEAAGYSYEKVQAKVNQLVK